MAGIHGGDAWAAVECQPASESAFEVGSWGTEFSSATIDAWARIREGLQSADFEGAARAERGDEPTRGNVLVGVGLGAVSEAGVPAGLPQGGCVVLYTERRLTVEAAVDYVKRAFAASAGAIEAARVRAEPTGPIELLSARARHRPAPGGVSLGHAQLTAGTLGCLCRGKRPPRDRYTLVLSNKHVLAATRQGQFGDPVLQPGPADGGQDPGNRLRRLERFVPIQGGATPNRVDCATARVVRPGFVSPWIAGFGGAAPRYFHATAQTAAARIGLAVRKAGRTSGLTDGLVGAVAWTGRVNVSGGGSVFVDQLVLEPPAGSGSFSRDGDSGSLVWTAAAPHAAVGLLFAGNRTGSLTLANPIGAVLGALDISLI